MSAGEGASSSSFWLRRWMEQSRSPRWIMLPCLSASTCAQRTLLDVAIQSYMMQVTSWLSNRHSAGSPHLHLGQARGTDALANSMTAACLSPGNPMSCRPRGGRTWNSMWRGLVTYFSR